MHYDGLEEKLIELSVQRYNRWYFWWGHFLAWLVVPIVLLLWLPGFKRKGTPSGWSGSP